MALEFARRGVDVALLARNQARLEAAAGEVRGQGVNALPIVTDVADADAVEAAAARIEAKSGTDRHLGQQRDGDDLCAD